LELENCAKEAKSAMAKTTNTDETRKIFAREDATV